jgi:hypothetical protein
MSQQQQYQQQQYHAAAQQGTPYGQPPQLDYTNYVMQAATDGYGQPQYFQGGQGGMQTFSPTVPQNSAASNPSSTKSVRQHNPYANSPSSEPLSPASAPGSSFASADGQNYFQSPVYGASSDATAQGHQQNFPQEGGAGGAMAYGINEQFEAVKGNICNTACSHRGRYVLISALRLQHVDKVQAIFDEIVPQLVHVVADQHGSHVVRTMVEFLNEAQVTAFVASLSRELILNLATSSQHTRRILQVLFERHRCAALQSVVDVMSENCVGLATTQQGCIAVMRVLENAIDCQKTQLLMALAPRLAALAMDPYGNYVVQSIAQHFNRDTGSEVIEQAFAGHWVALSRNKYASNVMEKVLNAATPLTRKAILDNLIYDQENLTAIMGDGFGNFVLQSIIDTCTTGTEFRKIQDKIRPNLSASPFAHKIEAKLKSKRFGPNPASNASATSSQSGNHRSSSNASTASGSLTTPRE